MKILMNNGAISNTIGPLYHTCAKMSSPLMVKRQKAAPVMRRLFKCQIIDFRG